mgnify:CR=1 FL=1
MNTTICMRADLAEEGLSVPASRTFSNYDTLDDDLYITAEELEGAIQGDDPADADDQRRGGGYRENRRYDERGEKSCCLFHLVPHYADRNATTIAAALKRHPRRAHGCYMQDSCRTKILFISNMLGFRRRPNVGES